MFALFESLGGIELVVVGIGALLLFGKDLPKVAADAGTQFAKLKRSLDTTWRDSGLEREVRQIRDSIPRDLSLRDVARTASEKLAVRLEAEDRARTADPAGSGVVARGQAIHEVQPETAPDPAAPSSGSTANPPAATPPAGNLPAPRPSASPAPDVDATPDDPTT